MDTPNPQRRTILRGALAAGATVVFFGCQRQEEGAPLDDTTPPTPDTTGTMSDPALTSPGTEPPAESAVPATPSAGEAPGGSTKVSKAQAQYQDNPKGDQMCSNCAFFIPETNMCKVVEGEVSPNGWSALWAPA